mgnify:FL=1
MLNISEIVGSGFTLIASDMTFDESRDQPSINEMFQKLQATLNEYGFDISIVANQEDAMRFQGKLLFDLMFKKLDKLIQDDNNV